MVLLRCLAGRAVVVVVVVALCSLFCAVALVVVVLVSLATGVRLLVRACVCVRGWCVGWLLVLHVCDDWGSWAS